MINSGSMGKLVIGIEVAPDHAFGRAFAEGVSKFAIEQKNWKLRALRQDELNAETLGRCDGAILRVLNDRVERIARETGIALVDISCERPRSGIAQITTDEAAAGRLAAEFLLFRGFTHFGTCGVNNFAYSDICTNAFCQRIGKSGFPVSHYECPARFRGKDILDNGTPYKTPDAADIRRWLHSLPKPAAVFCCNDHRAYQVMDTALKAGLNVPRDIAILGCDNDTMLCSFAEVPISSIDPDAFRVGYTAARLLHAIIQKRPIKRAHKTMLIPPKELVERESTEFAPFDPPWLAEAVLTIERNLADGISANEIFKSSGFSPPYVEKTFKQKLGCSVQTYITEARMKKAVTLLKIGELSTKEIAAACGYASPQYFCRVFKSRFGTSPQGKSCSF